MDVQLNVADGVAHSAALERRIRDHLEAVNHNFHGRLTRVEVRCRVGDDPRQRRCVMEGRPAGMEPVTVSAERGDIHDAVDETAEQLEHALARRLPRRCAGD